LQVRTADGWIDAVPPAGRVIINTGIMLEHLTNGIIPTGIHRVVAAAGHTGDRYSVVQFCHPTPWTILAPVASCITSEHPQRFVPIEAGDRLDQVLYDINLVEDARRVGDGR
jgi:isopenicillin N synthase-like dioxygenase